MTINLRVLIYVICELLFRPTVACAAMHLAILLPHDNKKEKLSARTACALAPSGKNCTKLSLLFLLTLAPMASPVSAYLLYTRK